MRLNDKKIEFNSKKIQSNLIKFISNPKFTPEPRISTKNRTFLENLAFNKSISRNIQTTLFQKDAKILKISGNISNFSDFWAEIFPNIIDSHLALDEMGIVGISDSKSLIDKSEIIDKFFIDFGIIFSIISKLKSLTSKKQCNDVKIITYSKSIIWIDSLALDEIIVIDLSGKLDLGTEDIPKKEGKEISIKKWDSSYKHINNQLIVKDFDKVSKIFIFKKDLRNHRLILKNHKQKYQNYFSIEQLYKLLDVLSKFQKYKRVQFDKIGFELYESNLKVVLNKKKNNWALFLARKTEIDDD